MGARRVVPLVGLALAILAACRSTPSFEVEPSLRYGAVTGSFQVPAGGKASSTSRERPTLEEMGVTSAAQVGLRGRARTGRHDVAVEARYLFLRGDGEADGDLTSQEEFFPDGTGLTSESGIATWGLGYGYRFPLGAEWAVTPRARVTWITVRYRIVGDNGATTDRSITHFAPGLGAEVEYRPEGSAACFSIRAAGTHRWRDRTVQALDLAVRAGMELAPGVEGWVEVGAQRILLEDTQEVPNQVDVRFLPTLGVGVTLAF